MISVYLLLDCMLLLFYMYASRQSGLGSPDKQGGYFVVIGSFTHRLRGISRHRRTSIA